jgi:protoporphyrinogen/coproporphyrinogen III oxidase
VSDAQGVRDVRSVVVVGAGVSGLVTALRLTQLDPLLDVTVLETDARPGGKMRDVEVGGLRLEAGPDSLLARKPWGVELCRELGLGDELVPSATGNTHIWSDSGLIRFPSGPFGISTDPFELWRWPGMSRRGKLRAIGDLWRRPGNQVGDESLGSLIRRRLGNEACDRLVAPLLGGLFAGDIDRLSVEATFPELAAWERDHRGLIRGARAAGKAFSGRTPAPMFMRLRQGFGHLAEELVRAVGPQRVRSGTAVTAIRSGGGGFVVSAGGTEFTADSVVLASPAFVSADLLEEAVPEAARSLRQIPYLSTAVILLVYPKGTGPPLPDSTGFVVPRGMATMTAATLVSRKWPDDAFGDRAVVRCFVGGAGSQDRLDGSDDELVESVCGELASVLPLPPRAEDTAVVRWLSAMPQYEVGHLGRVEAIERSLPPGVFVVGQAYRGTGVPDCVRAAGAVASGVLSYLACAGSRARGWSSAHGGPARLEDWPWA